MENTLNKLETECRKYDPPHEILKSLPTEILIKIFSYLHCNDWKQTRLVCKRWNDIINMSYFMKQTRLEINENNIESLKTHLRTYHTVPFIYAQMVLIKNLSCSSDLEYILSRIGKHTRSLVLIKSNVFPNIRDKLPNLEELQIRTAFITPEEEHLDSIDFNNFVKLRSLHVCSNSINPNVYGHILNQLSDPNTKVKLERIYLLYRTKEELLILKALETHAETLKHIHIGFVSSSSKAGKSKCDELFQKLHLLETIEISANCRFETLLLIVKQIPESAPLKVVTFFGAVEMNDDLLLLLVRKWQKTIEELTIVFCVFLSDDSVIQLKQLENTLRILNLSQCQGITKRGLVQGIASQMNTNLRELHLSGMKLLDESTVCILAQRLPNLVKYDLEDCYNAVTDKSISQIFRYQTKLEELILNDCIEITDDGFIGFGDTPYPISRLQRLKVLSIRSCRNITDATLLQGLHIGGLNDVCLGYCNKISAVGIAELVIRCPDIEALSVFSCTKVDDECVLHITAGLRHLRILNMNNCPALTNRAMDFIIEFCKSLRFLELYGIASLDMNDAIIQRLKTALPNIKCCY